MAEKKQTNGEEEVESSKRTYQCHKEDNAGSRKTRGSNKAEEQKRKRSPEKGSMKA